MIINLTGQAGAGKTTIAQELLKIIPNSINIDGDNLRDILKNTDYSENGRRENIKNAYNIARFLENQGFIPVISLISPFKDLRDNLKQTTKVLECYIHTTEVRGREKFFAKNYQAPTEDFLSIDTTGKKASELVHKIWVHKTDQKPYNLFIGRYQSPHKGHQTIFNEYISKGLPILIAVRDVPTDEKNPLTAKQVKQIWETIYKGNDLVKVMVFPDISSVNYGRGVGYEVKEIQVDKAVSNISATYIRSQIKSGQEDWKEMVDDKAHDLLKSLLINS